MVCAESRYPLTVESEYCSMPGQCRTADVLVIGSGVALSMITYLLKLAERVGRQLRVVVAEAGPMDLLTHLAHANIPRHLFISRGELGRVGGKLALWGVSAPRPPEELLRRWPFDYATLSAYFDEVEREMGIPDAIPKSKGTLQADLLTRLRAQFPQWPVRVAPLAIDRDGRRWCPLATVPELTRSGVRLLARFQCESLRAAGGRIVEVRGKWLDGRLYSLRPRFVVLGVGVEASLPLLAQVCRRPLPLETADHLRIDLHGSLPTGSLGDTWIDELGVAVLLMECRSRTAQVPYHLEIKVAPRGLWRRGYMPSGDNLRGTSDDTALWIQIQAIAATHDRFPAHDLLNVAGIPPVLSARDAVLHGEIVGVMQQVAAAIGLEQPIFAFRPLLTNHHTYGAFRVGKAVTREFRWQGIENLYVLPPTAYVDLDDDANPVLKSRVLARFAMDDIARQLTSTTAE